MPLRKLLLTGASGLVGSHVASTAARRGFEVIGVVGRFPGTVPGLHRQIGLDLADPSRIQTLALEIFPDAIVNAAALSEPILCDQNPPLAHALNIVLPTLLAQTAHHLGARLIHISSEQVFDGEHAPYRAGDAVAPPSLYARQKVASEDAVARFAPETGTTLRLPLLAGNSLTGTRSLHERLFLQWAAGRRACLFHDEVRQPCSAENAAETIVELCERHDNRSLGIQHWAGTQALSRLEIGRRIASHFRLPIETLIESASRTTAQTSGSPPRQRDLSLDCSPLSSLLKNRQEDFSTLLERLAIPPAARSWYLAL